LLAIIFNRCGHRICGIFIGVLFISTNCMYLIYCDDTRERTNEMVLVFFFLRKVKMKSPDRVSQHFLITGKWGKLKMTKGKKIRCSLILQVAGA
jgi:hypothetical protein